MPEDLLSSARETVTAFVQAARCCAKYPPGHARRAETFEFLAIRATAHGERWGDLRLELAPPKAIVVMGNPVHEDGTPDHPPIAQAFAQSGIRALTLETGIAREELQQLVEIFGKLGKNDEDIVCALWRAGLWAVQLDADDDIDKNDSITAAETVAIHERIEDARQKARERTDDLSGAPPQGRDWAVEAPPPAPVSPEETRTQLAVADLAPRAFEVTKTALWRADSPLPAEHATKLFVEVIRRALQNGDLPASADLLDKADPDEAPNAAVRAAEKTTAQLGAEIVRCVPALYVKLAAKGEESALAIALRCLNHLDTAGVQKAAAAYAEVPVAGRRPLRRVLSARGAEALEGIVRIADHKNLEIAKDGLAMLAVTPLDAAKKAIERFANDPTLPRDRLELAKGALAHHQQLAPKASKTTVSAVSQQLCSNLRDASREKRLAAARSLAKMGPDNVAFTAVQGLVTLPGFPQADEEEQKALIDALVGSGGDAALKVLETVAMKTLGLPTSRMCRQAADALKRARGAKA